MTIDVLSISGILFENLMRNLHHLLYFDLYIEQYSNEVVEIVIFKIADCAKLPCLIAWC